MPFQRRLQPTAIANDNGLHYSTRATEPLMPPAPTEQAAESRNTTSGADAHEMKARSLQIQRLIAELFSEGCTINWQLLLPPFQGKSEPYNGSHRNYRFASTGRRRQVNFGTDAPGKVALGIDDRLLHVPIALRLACPINAAVLR